MNKIFWLALTGCSALLALDGKVIFESKCASCHSSYIPLGQLINNAKHNNTILNIKAPTLNQLSFGMRLNVGDRKADEDSQRLEVEDFIGTYVDTPDRNKSVIPSDMTRFFPDMPSMKGQLDEDEIEELSNYIFDYGEEMIVAHSAPVVSWEKAKELAAKEHKIIMIRGVLPFCKWCIQMDREVMVEKEVVDALNKDFVVVKMDVIQDKLPLGMKSLGTPSFYFINSDGKTIIDQMQGYGNKEEFLELLRKIKEDAKN
ncbi:MAG: DUF255 domain-containing protein [Campylobacterales bacterium]|nr:DUF255 domain-containing protein [Campylobacterales bacterium]